MIISIAEAVASFFNSQLDQLNSQQLNLQTSTRCIIREWPHGGAAGQNSAFSADRKTKLATEVRNKSGSSLQKQMRLITQLPHS